MYYQNMSPEQVVCLPSYLQPVETQYLMQAHKQMSSSCSVCMKELSVNPELSRLDTEYFLQKSHELFSARL